MIDITPISVDWTIFVNVDWNCYERSWTTPFYR